MTDVALDEPSMVQLSVLQATRLVAPDLARFVKGTVRIQGDVYTMMEDARRRIWLCQVGSVFIGADGRAYSNGNEGPGDKYISGGRKGSESARFRVSVYIPVSGPWTAEDLAAPLIAEEIMDALGGKW